MLSHLEAARLAEAGLTVVRVGDDHVVVAIVHGALRVVKVVAEGPVTRARRLAESLIRSARVRGADGEDARARVRGQFAEKSVAEFLLSGRR